MANRKLDTINHDDLYSNPTFLAQINVPLQYQLLEIIIFKSIHEIVSDSYSESLK